MSKGYFLMLPLPTEVTIEAMNVSTDQRRRFKQFGFRQQNIMDDVERDMEMLNGKGSLRH